MSGGGARPQGTGGRSPVSRTNVQCLLTRSYTGSWGLYYIPVGHHVNPGMIHHAQESSDTRSLVTHLQLQICHCKSCGTSCLSKTKPLYYILNQRSVSAPGAEHPGCLVKSAGLQMDFMATRVNDWLKYSRRYLTSTFTRTHNYGLSYSCVNSMLSLHVESVSLFSF